MAHLDTFCKRTQGSLKPMQEFAPGYTNLSKTQNGSCEDPGFACTRFRSRNSLSNDDYASEDKRACDARIPAAVRIRMTQERL